MSNHGSLSIVHGRDPKTISEYKASPLNLFLLVIIFIKASIESKSSGNSIPSRCIFLLPFASICCSCCSFLLLVSHRRHQLGSAIWIHNLNYRIQKRKIRETSVKLEKKRKHKKEKKHKTTKKHGLRRNGDENNESNTTLFEEDIIPTSDQVVEEYGAELLEELEEYDVLIEDGDEENSTRTRELALTDKFTRLWKDRVDGVVTVAYKFDNGSFGSKSHFSESEKQTSKSTLPELLFFFAHCIFFSLTITP